MGIFSRKKTITVSSTSYNLAGDQANRVQFLPTLILGEILKPTAQGLGSTIVENLLAGQGIRMRSFARWARTTGYTALVGQTAGRLAGGNSIDTTIIETQIPPRIDHTITIQTAEVDGAEFSYWAERWLIENHPNEINSDYTLDYKEETNEIIITMPLGGPIYTVTPTDFDTANDYLYVSYQYLGIGGVEPIIPGIITVVPDAASFPDTSGWSSAVETITAVPVALVTKVDVAVTYSDATPPTNSTSSNTDATNYNEITNEYEVTLYVGTDPTNRYRSISDRKVQRNTVSRVVQQTVSTVVTTATLAGGVIQTTTTTTTVDSLVPYYSYTLDTQVIINNTWTDMQVMIYGRGTGNTVLDAMFAPDADAGAFFPFIPIRHMNRFLSPSNSGAVYARSQIAMKKATGSKYSKVEKGIKTTDKLKDIDHVYAVFGVALNVRERSAKKYLYQFFDFVIDNIGNSATGFNQWEVNWNLADISRNSWISWRDAQSVPLDPLFGTPEPARLPYPSLPSQKIRIRGAFSYDMEISWAGISKATYPGKGKAGVRVGEAWLTQGAVQNYTEILDSAGIVGSRIQSKDATNFHWQETEDTYHTISVRSLVHNNRIYKGKAVTTTAREALNDAEESGFILPLHEGVFRAMSLKDATQMASANGYLVFNSYTVTKQKWYQTTLFKIIIVIIIIVVSIFFPPAGGFGAGLLGTAATVGGALGLVGATALIVGAIANALAAMLLARILTAASTALFGERIGMIVGTIATIAATAYASGAQSGQGFAASFGDMASASNIMKLTVAAGEGYTGYLSDKTAKIVADSQKILTDYNRKSKEIADKYYNEFGGKGAVIDPITLLDTPEASSFFPETPSMFLSRTLMTGSDVVAMSQDLLTNFTSLSTSVSQ